MGEAKRRKKLDPSYGKPKGNGRPSAFIPIPFDIVVWDGKPLDVYGVRLPVGGSMLMIAQPERLGSNDELYRSIALQVDDLPADGLWSIPLVIDNTALAGFLLAGNCYSKCIWFEVSDGHPLPGRNLLDWLGTMDSVKWISSCIESMAHCGAFYHLPAKPN